MPDILPQIAPLLAGLAAGFALLAFLAARQARAGSPQLAELVARSVREEGDRIRRVAEDHARTSRQDLAAAIDRLQASTLAIHAKSGEGLAARMDQFAARLDGAVRNIDERVIGIAARLNEDMGRLGTEAAENRDRLRLTIEAKLDDASAKQNRAAADFRDSVGVNLEAARAGIRDMLVQMSGQQAERLDGVNGALTSLIERHAQGQDALRQAVEGRLDALRSENSAKLEEMRATVDEKLRTTLETRLGESFNRVVEQLERVHKGIGEMQTLATNVGDLKNVLGNVKIRGTYGEVQLAMLLDEFLTPDQILRDAQVRENSLERVEFAVRMPGGGDGQPLLLPIDAKFPREDYERLMAAADSGDTRLIAEFRKALQNRVKSCAKDICAKYINPPLTTNFAVLFLPTESLYAEVLRAPGLFEQIQREHRVTLASPTTLSALLNALQMGFRTLAIEKRSSEVWQILGAVRTEFGKYNKVVEQIEKQLSTTQNSIARLGQRTRVMSRTLKGVEVLTADAAAEKLLGLEDVTLEPDEEEAEPVALPAKSSVVVPFAAN